MWCSEFSTRNFRNLSSLRISWGPGLNLVTGNNGAGKTNCLEGLHLLTGWGPFGDRTDLVSWETEGGQAFLSGSFSGEENLFVAASIGGNTVMKCDGRRISFPEVRSRVPALAFLPGDMSILDGAPSIRRNFLDRLCALLFPLYARRLSDYRRAVRHRTVLLRSGKRTDAVSRTMAPLVSWIWECREEAVRLLTLGLSAFQGLLPGILELKHARGGAGLKNNGIEDWWASLEARSEKEKQLCISMVGPHRDDLYICCREREAAACFSRGQIRRASVSLMLAAGKAVEARLRRKPIVLLDEIASELDKNGRESTVEALHSTGWQVIAAAAEPITDHWPGSVWKVEEGFVISLGA